MKTLTVNEISLAIPETPNEWELYEHKHGANIAANELTHALIKAMSAPSNQQAHIIMATAMNNNAKYGACDTEPRTIVNHYFKISRNINFYL